MARISKQESGTTNELAEIANIIAGESRGTRGKKRQDILNHAQLNVDSVLRDYGHIENPTRRLDLNVLFDTLKIVLGRNKNKQRKDLGNWPES